MENCAIGRQIFSRRNRAYVKRELVDRPLPTADIETYNVRGEEIGSDHAVDSDSAIVDGQEALRSEISSSKNEPSHPMRGRGGVGCAGLDGGTHD